MLSIFAFNSELFGTHGIDQCDNQTVNFPDLVQTVLIYALPVLFAITLHEAAHGYAARFFGDNTAWMMGRITEFARTLYLSIPALVN